MRASSSRAGRATRLWAWAFSSANRSSRSSSWASPVLASRSSLSLQTKRPRPLASANLKGCSSCWASAGRSLFTSCSCRATVAVEISTRVPRASAIEMAGMLYASDLPTPFRPAPRQWTGWAPARPHRFFPAGPGSRSARPGLPFFAALTISNPGWLRPRHRRISGLGQPIFSCISAYFDQMDHFGPSVYKYSYSDMY